VFWAYFDTNIFDHIDKGLIPPDDVGALRNAIASKEVGVHLSIADVEELLGQWDSNRVAAVRKLRLAGDLVGFDRLLLPAQAILDDAIRAYAEGAPPPNVTAPRRLRVSWSAVLSKIAAGRGSLDGEIAGAIRAVHALKQRFRDGMPHGRGAQIAEDMMKAEPEIPAYTFNQVWERMALPWAEGFAARCDLTQRCAARGFEGLLHLRPVRIAVGAGLSLVHAQVVERRSPRPSDAYDLWHAVMASAADVFVTRDESFARLLARVPMDNFTIATSINALLEYARRRPEGRRQQ
jgi:hypothetical protein